MIIVVASLFIGTLCLLLGYKLLMRGVYSDADAKAAWSDTSLLIKRSAPGVAFALFGGAMIVVGLLHSSRLHRREAPPAPEQTQTEQAPPLKQSTPSQPAKRRHAREERNSRQPGSPQQATQPGTNQEKDSSRDDANQSTPVPKAWKPGRA
jgi:hypothetical protein